MLSWELMAQVDRCMGPGASGSDVSSCLCSHGLTAMLEVGCGILGERRRENSEAQQAWLGLEVMGMGPKLELGAVCSPRLGCRKGREKFSVCL